MSSRIINSALLAQELTYTSSRGTGPGGQHVNKVSSRITVAFDVAGSRILTPEERLRLLDKLRAKLTKEGVLQLSSDSHRSQLQNKRAVKDRLDDLLLNALTVQKPRKPTRPSRSSLEKRKFSKQVNSEKKRWRQKP